MTKLEAIKEAAHLHEEAARNHAVTGVALAAKEAELAAAHALPDDEDAEPETAAPAAIIEPTPEE